MIFIGAATHHFRVIALEIWSRFHAPTPPRKREIAHIRSSPVAPAFTRGLDVVGCLSSVRNRRRSYSYEFYCGKVNFCVKSRRDFVFSSGKLSITSRTYPSRVSFRFDGKTFRRHCDRRCWWSYLMLIKTMVDGITLMRLINFFMVVIATKISYIIASGW